MPVGTITALRAQARDSQRINVFIDDEFAIGVSLNTLAHEGLFVGREIDEEAWIRLEQRESSERARQMALRLIERRPRSISEVRRHLRAKGFAAEVAAHAVDRLVEAGLLDDAAFCSYWIENRRAYRPRGNLALRDELRRKGVARETIDRVLATLEEAPGAEHERALALGRSVVQRYAGSDTVAFRRRLGGFLQRRGFAVETVIAVVSQLERERGTDPDDPVPESDDI
jgi:regulatory protein